jgi:hypothetical protein
MHVILPEHEEFSVRKELSVYKLQHFGCSLFRVLGPQRRGSEAEVRLQVSQETELLI